MIADDDGAVGGGFGDLVVGEDVEVVSPLATWPLARLEFWPAMTCTCGKADAVAGELGGVELHADGGEGCADDGDLADAGDLRDALLDDGGGFVVEGGDVVDVRLEAEDHDGKSAGLTLR